ncbi:hypothetical protein KAJ89_04135 [Candidatus Parcubacteria bacterium]|nr:hypothetical protein [Candidatus Parcubacteria bacterium]
MNRLRYNSVEKKLLNSNISIFTVDDFSKIFNAEKDKARLFLSRYSKKQDSPFKRIKRGVYIFLINPPIKYEVANTIYKPSYISFESALSYYNIIPETVYSITSATTKRSENFEIGELNYQYYKLKKKLFFGYRPVVMQDKIIQFAEKEKALLDYVYLMALKKKSLNERINLEKINKDKLAYYIVYFRENITKNKVFIKTVDLIYRGL